MQNGNITNFSSDNSNVPNGYIIITHEKWNTAAAEATEAAAIF